MSDVCLVKPIFFDAAATRWSPSRRPRRTCRTSAGGSAPSRPRELFEEGFHIPLTHLIREGRVDDTLVALLAANVRTPDQTVGDIWAQVSANELMENRVKRLMEEYELTSLEGPRRRALRPLGARDARGDPRGARRHLPVRHRHRRLRGALPLQRRAHGGGRPHRGRLRRHRHRPSRARSTA